MKIVLVPEQPVETVQKDLELEAKVQQDLIHQASKRSKEPKTIKEYFKPKMETWEL